MTNAGVGRSGVGPERDPQVASAKRTWYACTGPLGVGKAVGSRKSGRLITGRAILLGDGVSTDAMIAGKYCKQAEGRLLAAHIFEGTSSERKSWMGTIIIAGKNFGCGSSREQAPLALKAAGVRAVAARSFGRIFFRNAINIGLLVMNIDRVMDRAREGDEIIMDLESGTIRNRTMEIIRGRPLPDLLMGILRAGGLVPFTRARLRTRPKDRPS